MSPTISLNSNHLIVQFQNCIKKKVANIDSINNPFFVLLVSAQNPII